MHRLRGFDYKRPFFYMVTLKRLPMLAAFSQIATEDEPSRHTSVAVLLPGGAILGIRYNFY